MADARRSPSARLYSLVPRLSACPSTITFVVGHRFIHSMFFWSAVRAVSFSSVESRLKNASASGFSALSCSSVLLRNNSSSVGGAGCGAGGGGGGGGGVLGVAGGAGAAAGGGGGAGASFLAHAPTVRAATIITATHVYVLRIINSSPGERSRRIGEEWSLPSS